MAHDDYRLTLLPFPQRWDGQRLRASLLVLPVGDPLNAPLFDSGAAFAGTPLTLQLVVQPGPADFKVNLAGNRSTLLTPLPAFDDARALFAALAEQFSPTSAPPAQLALSRQKRAQRLDALGSVYKVLPESYKSATGLVEPRDPRYVLSEHEYACRMRGQTPAPKPTQPDTVSWGQVISYALKQPKLARAMGLIYDFDVEIPGQDMATLLAEGGWLYLGLAPAMIGGPLGWSAERTDCYAARLPPLSTQGRPLFAAVLFPDDEILQGSEANRVPSEAMEYDDGFAGAVHLRQPTTADACSEEGGYALPPGAEAGIQIGWDDEQVLAWVNRQLDNSRARGDASVTATRAPLGVAGYRVDVRVQGSADGWQTLCGVTGKARLGPWSAEIAGEFAVDTPPQRPNLESDVMLTLPRYFAAWRGTSLVLADPVAQRLAGRRPAASAWTAQAAPPLRYGERYDFRVRLVDLTGGGPQVGDVAINPAAAPVASVRFERRVPPKAMRLATDDPASPTRLTLRRPLLAYPDFVFAGVDASADLVAELVGNLTAERSMVFGVGIPDPDVSHVAITVQVLTPRGDAGGALPRDGEFVEVYTVLKELPARDGFPATSPRFADEESALAVNIDYVDCADIEAAAGDLATASSGDRLAVPTGRNVRLRIRPANLPAATTPSHFAPALRQSVAGHDVALGLLADVALRREEIKPVQLLDVHLRPTERCVAMLLQPLDLLGQPSPDPVQLVAETLDLEADGMSLRARPGRRVAFAASGALRHMLADGNGKITFASRDELYGHWLVARRVRLERDWTWSGLVDQGIAIERPAAATGEPAEAIGEVALPFVVSKQANKGKDEPRNYSELIFFDAIQPADADPLTGIGRVQKVNWQARAMLRSGAAVVGQECHVTLPIARPPGTQPAIAAVGIARPATVVPEADGGYAATPAMPKSLWIEFEQGLAIDGKHPDRGLKYFARVLGYGPDPLITPAQSIPLFGKFPEPPLPVDPEWIRVIRPGQSADRAGYEAMVELLPAEPAAPGAAIRHWLLPLPPGVDADSPALFGFWTYELRVGYGGEHWTTARARFSRPLRVTGVQHPAPEIVCNVYRSQGVQTNVLPKPDAPIFTHAAHLLMQTALSQYPAPSVAKADRIALATLKLSISPAELAQYQAATGAAVGGGELAITSEAPISPTAADWFTEVLAGGDIVVQAPFAVSLVDGRPITYAIALFSSNLASMAAPRLPQRVPTQPLSNLWALLYVQIEQADASGQRNLLLARQPMPFAGDLERVTRDPSQWFGRTVFERAAVELQLAELGLPANAALSVLVVELLPNSAAQPVEEFPAPPRGSTSPEAVRSANLLAADPLGLGRQRILRTSPLTPIQDVC